jgi:hypothetical protein
MKKFVLLLILPFALAACADSGPTMSEQITKQHNQMMRAYGIWAK